MNINSIIFQYAAIGDYLFLIMIVVASIVQAISQNKKKESVAGDDHEKGYPNNHINAGSSRNKT